MRIQISSGQGPAECELAAGLLYEELKKEASDIRLLSFTQGKKREGFSSIVFETVSILEAVPRVTEEKLVRFETFRSGGKGGQNVNKVETGVRAIHIPTGTAVVSTEARSQHMNKQIALNRLCEILAEMNMESGRREKNLAWMEHARLERGNPVRVYEGRSFRLKTEKNGG